MKKSSKTILKWIGIVVVLAMVRGGAHRTSKEIVQEASGQKAIPSDASAEERQHVDLVAQVIANRKEMDALDESFNNTFTGSHLLQPESFSSPEIATQSLVAVEQYCDSTKLLMQKANVLVVREDTMDGTTGGHLWITNQFNAAMDSCSAVVELYNFASDPLRHVSVENDTVHIKDFEGYNERIAKVNDAREKLKSANAIFHVEQKKVRQEDNVTASDYGVKE